MVIKALYGYERGFWNRQGSCQDPSTLGCSVFGAEEENEQGAETKTKREKKRVKKQRKKN